MKNKKFDKQIKNIAKQLIEDECKKQNLSLDQTNMILNSLDETSNLKKPQPEDYIDERIQSSIYFKHNELHTSILELLGEYDCLDDIYKYFLNYLKNNELQIYIDDSLKDESAIFIIYKLNNYLLFEYLHSRSAKEKVFNIDPTTINYCYPKFKKLNKKEVTSFIDNIKGNKHNMLFSFKEEKYKKTNTPNIKNTKRLMFLGFLFRYGLIAISLILLVLSSIICKNIESLNPYMGLVTFTSFSIPLIIMGIDYIIASIFKFPHILLVNQSANHQKIDVEKLSWNDFNSKEFIGIGITFIVFGIILIVFSLLNFYKII